MLGLRINTSHLQRNNNSQSACRLYEYVASNLLMQRLLARCMT